MSTVNNSLLMNVSNGAPGVTNISDDFDIEKVMGPRRETLSTAIAMTFTYVVILVTGMVGNICTCIVIARNRYMHTATNYYLFSLAVSDLLLLVLGLPQDTFQLWSKYPYVFGEVFCVLRGWTSETSTNASILTITAFTAERYVAICHPLRAHTMSRLSRAVKFIIVIWICAALSAISQGYQLGILYEKDNTGHVVLDTAHCGIKRPLSHSFETSTFVFFVFPSTLLSILYILIGLQLRRSTMIARKHNGQVSTNGVKNQSKAASALNRQSTRKNSTSSRKAVVKMLVAVVVAFFLCWAPFHAQRLMAVYITEPTEADYRAFYILTNISGITYYVSATINPILYSIMSLKFRHAFQDTLGRCLGRRSVRRQRTRMTSIYNSTLRSAGYEATDFTLVSDSPKNDAKSRRMSTRPSGERRNPGNVVIANPIENSNIITEESANRSLTRNSKNGSTSHVVAFDERDITEFIDETETSAEK